tara:strand:+ start:490 stop:1893 length:1404 start_codon:yes stop_codon:yes gene_type:complete
MTEQKSYASEYTLKGIALFPADAKEGEKPYENIMGLVTHFYHIEDIMNPAYEAKMVVVDNATNLISDLPIQGNERVVVEVEDIFNKTYYYEYRVWTVANRLNADRKQVFTLGLTSSEGMDNEGVRLSRPLEGQISKMVLKLLTEDLLVPEDNIFIDETKTSAKIIPRKQSIFSVIRSLQLKGVPKEDYTGSGTATVITTMGGEVVSEDSQSVRDGSAGYLFFQTRKGFHFQSFDKLCSQEPVNKKEKDWFTYTPAKMDDGDPPTKIQEISYKKEIDMLRKLREGAFSSLSCYFNINTGKYEEYVYSMSEVWDKMVHLGSSTDLPIGQKELSQSPTRVFSSVINDEFWYTGTEPAVSDSKNEIKDYQKFYMQQSVGRAAIMFNQHLSISLTGHLEISAGDLVEIRIPEQASEVLKEGENETWDKEHSGTFLVKRVTHQFHNSFRQVYTVLELIRDSLGIKDRLTNTKT